MAPKGDEQGSADEPQQDPHVRNLRPDPSQPPIRALTLAGFLSNSDRPGFQRLYFTRELDQYAEFLSSDVLGTEPVPADQAPFVGLDATRVTLRRDAMVEYTRTHVASAADEFDVDVRLGAAGDPS